MQLGFKLDKDKLDTIYGEFLKLADKKKEIRDDDIAMVRTKGIIGDRYIKISRGASERFIPEGGTITETESAVDIEDVIGKIVHAVSGEKSEDKEGSAKTSE